MSHNNRPSLVPSQSVKPPAPPAGKSPDAEPSPAKAEGETSEAEAAAPVSTAIPDAMPVLVLGVYQCDRHKVALVLQPSSSRDSGVQWWACPTKGCFCRRRVVDEALYGSPHVNRSRGIQRP